MKSILLFLLVLCSVPAFAADGILADQRAAEARYLPAADIKVGWGGHCVSRGGTTIVYDVTREYDMDGEQIAGSSFFNWASHSGTIAAVPIGDFCPLAEFHYRGKDRKGVPGELLGRLVGVQIQISAGNGTPAEMVMQRAVENLTKTGVSLPPAAGAKPGRLLSMMESAKRRFGARIAKPRYDARKGAVYLLLLDCLDDKADESYVPATPQGASREQRLATAVRLKRGENRGGTRFFGSETEIIPVGSRRVPFDGAPAVRVN